MEFGKIFCTQKFFHVSNQMTNVVFVSRFDEVGVGKFNPLGGCGGGGEGEQGVSGGGFTGKGQNENRKTTPIVGVVGGVGGGKPNVGKAIHTKRKNAKCT